MAVAGAAVGSRSPRRWSARPAARGCCPSSAVAVLAAPVLGTSRPAGPRASGGCPPTARPGVSPCDGDRCAACVLEAAVVGLAGVTFVALRQRGPVAGDLTPASAPTLWALVGALVLVRVLPPLVRLVLRTARRSAGRLWFFVAARVAAAGCARCRWSSWWSRWPSSRSAPRWPPPSSAARSRAPCSPSAATPGSRRRRSAVRTERPRSARRPASGSRSPAASRTRRWRPRCPRAPRSAWWSSTPAPTSDCWPRATCPTRPSSSG